MDIKYYRLRGKGYENVIVRTEGSKWYQYVKGKGWVRSGVMIKFFCDESDYYDLEKEITEEEALKYIEDYWT